MKILLMCANGLSTGILMNKMNQWAEQNNEDLEVKAIPIDDYLSVYKDYDVLLVGPQMRYKIKDVQKAVTDRPSAVINPSDYALGNVENIIKEVKDSVKIPVIGNGDIVDEETAYQMFEKTGVDGIMIGRGSFGNPWIFRNIKHFLITGEKLPSPTNSERLNIIKEHIDLAVEEKGEIAIKELRKHIAWYTKNLKNSSEFRNSINMIETKEQLIKTLNEYFETL